MLLGIWSCTYHMKEEEIGIVALILDICSNATESSSLESYPENGINDRKQVAYSFVVLKSQNRAQYFVYNTTEMEKVITRRQTAKYFQTKS